MSTKANVQKLLRGNGIQCQLVSTGKIVKAAQKDPNNPIKFDVGQRAVVEFDEKANAWVIVGKAAA